MRAPCSANPSLQEYLAAPPSLVVVISTRPFLGASNLPQLTAGKNKTNVQRFIDTVSAYTSTVLIKVERLQLRQIKLCKVANYLQYFFVGVS